MPGILRANQTNYYFILDILWLVLTLRCITAKGCLLFPFKRITIDADSPVVFN